MSSVLSRFSKSPKIFTNLRVHSKPRCLLTQHRFACSNHNTPIQGPTQPVDLSQSKVDAEIAQILIDTFEPEAIHVINQSKMHSRGDQTHYKVILAGSDYLNELKRPVKQQQAVLKALKDTMYNTTLHSVSVKIHKSERDIQEADKISPGCANHKKK